MLAGCGITVMVVEGLSLGHLLGNVAALISAVGFACMTVALRWGKASDMLPAICLGGVFTGILAAVACLVTGVGFALSAGDTLLALSLGVVQLGLGLACFTAGSKVLSAAELALLSMSEVLLGPIWVWLFMSEVPGALTLLGGAVLMTAIGLNALTGLRRRRPPIGVM